MIPPPALQDNTSGLARRSISMNVKQAHLAALTAAFFISAVLFANSGME
jgi:hypothetical protein